MEEVLFKTEEVQSRHQIAKYLRTIAENLENKQNITLRSGDDAVTLDPPTNPVFEVKAEREGEGDMEGEMSLELEIEWDQGERTDEALEIE